MAAAIRKTTAGTWQVRWRTIGGEQKKRAFKRRVDAEAFVTNLEAARLKGENLNPQLAKTPFAAWVREWEDGRLGRRASTRDRDASIVRNHVLPHFGAMTLGAIEPADVRSWVKTLTETLSPATTRKAYELLSSCLRTAVEDGLIGRSPCRGIQLPRLERSEPRFLDLDDIGRLAEAMPARYRALVLTAAFTGLRWGELAALRVSDFEPLQRRLRVNQTVTRDHGTSGVGPPKTQASRRAVSLPANLVDALAAHLAEYRSEGGLVFTGSQGTMLDASRFRRRVWLPAVARAGLEGLHFHDLRHTHAALLIRSGEHVKVIQSRLGHASARITLDVYGHLFDGLDQGAADRLNEAVSEARAPKVRPIGALRLSDAG